METLSQLIKSYGYLGVFLLPMLANATVFVPIPGVMVIFTMAAVLNPILVAVVGGLGAATGELTGYLVGFSGQGLAEHVVLPPYVVPLLGEHQAMVMIVRPVGELQLGCPVEHFLLQLRVRLAQRLDRRSPFGFGLLRSFSELLSLE